MVLHCAPSSLDFSSLVKCWDRKQLIPWLPELRSKDLVCVCALPGQAVLWGSEVIRDCMERAVTFSQPHSHQKCMLTPHVWKPAMGMEVLWPS